MRRIIIAPLLAVLSLVLIPLCANAAPTDQPDFFVNNTMVKGPGSVSYLYYTIGGSGVKTVKLFLLNVSRRHQTAPTSYLTVLKTGTSRYYTLKKPLFVPKNQNSKAMTIPKGTKYWVRTNLRLNPANSTRVRIAVKVSPNIPKHTLFCVGTSALGTSPPVGDQTAYFGFLPAGEGACASGLQWLVY